MHLVFLISPRKDLHMTKNLLKSTLILLGFVLGTCSFANALMFKHTPEIDPSLAVSAFALLAGSLAVLRTQRKK